MKASLEVLVWTKLRLSPHGAVDVSRKWSTVKQAPLRNTPSPPSFVSMSVFAILWPLPFHTNICLSLSNFSCPVSILLYNRLFPEHR